jgi:ADP-ribose pyrophosphatase YjhB (NUDIX family)
MNRDVNFCLRCGSALEKRLKVGEVRPVCPDCGWTYFPDPKVAVAVVVEQEGKILFVQRMMEPRRGYWTLPAGFVDAGEDPIQAAVREVKEETNLEVDHLELLGILPVKEHAAGADLLLVYRGEITGGKLRAGDDASRAEFFPLEDHPAFAFQSTKRIFQELLEQDPA